MSKSGNPDQSPLPPEAGHRVAAAVHLYPSWCNGALDILRCPPWLLPLLNKLHLAVLKEVEHKDDKHSPKGTETYTTRPKGMPDHHPRSC